MNNSTANGSGRLVMVTGGAGFIGSNLVDAIILRGFSVRVLDNFATGMRENLNPRAELVEADVGDTGAARHAMRGVDCVFHVAALPRIPLSIAHPMETLMANAVGPCAIRARQRPMRVFARVAAPSARGRRVQGVYRGLRLERAKCYLGRNRVACHGPLRHRLIDPLAPLGVEVLHFLRAGARALSQGSPEGSKTVAWRNHKTWGRG